MSSLFKQGRIAENIQGLLARRKIALVVLLAIFLHSLYVGYLGITAFSERREAVKGVLEPNLLSSIGTALKSIEDELFHREKEIRESITARLDNSLLPKEGKFSPESHRIFSTKGYILSSVNGGF